MIRAAMERPGRFSFRRRIGEPYALRLESPRGGLSVGRVEAMNTTPVVTIALGSGRAEIVLRHGEQPAEGITVRLLSVEGIAAWAVTDASGSANLGQLTPGVYETEANGRPLGTIAVKPAGTAALAVTLD